MLNTLTSGRKLLIGLSIASTLSVGVVQSAMANSDNSELKKQLQKQLEAMKAGQNLKSLEVTKIAQGRGFTLYNTTSKSDPKWGKTLEEAYGVFESSVGEARSIDIVLVDQPQDALRVDQSKFNRPLVLPIGALSGSKKLSNESLIENLMRHESCHVWLIDYAKSNGLNPSANANGMPSYGHPQLPDWLDESVAVMCENIDLKKQRISESNYQPIAMRKYFDMEHPVFADIKSKITQQMNETGSDDMVFTFSEEEMPDIEVGEDLHYYTQSEYFNQFLREKFGNGALGDIAKDIIKGMKIDESLAKRFKIKSVAQLQSQFNDYLKAFK